MSDTYKKYNHFLKLDLLNFIGKSNKLKMHINSYCNFLLKVKKLYL